MPNQESRGRRKPPTVTPPPSNIFPAISALPGGGTATCVDVHPGNADAICVVCDTAGARFSMDGGSTWFIWMKGLESDDNAWRAPAIYWSKRYASKYRCFMACGSGGTGVLAVAESLDTDTPTAWSQLIRTSDNLDFTGGNATDHEKTTFFGNYNFPRHWTSIQIDEYSDPSYTYLYVGTTNDGAWRIKMNNTTLAIMEKTQIGGTNGKYCQNVQLCVDHDNVGNASWDTLFVALLDRVGTAEPLRVCKNARAALPTSQQIAGITNIEAMCYVHGNFAGAQRVLVAVKDGEVYYCTNPTVGGTTDPAFTAFSAGPDAAAWWMSCTAVWFAATQKYILYCGSYQPVASPGPGNKGMYVGTWDGTKTTINSVITWSYRDSGDDTKYVMNTGNAADLFWLRNAATFCNTGQSAINRISVAKTNKNRIYASIRTGVHRSDDGGSKWYPTNYPAQAGGKGCAVDKGNKLRSAWCTVDYPLIVSDDAWVHQPTLVTSGVINTPYNYTDAQGTHNQAANARGPRFDQKTHEVLHAMSAGPKDNRDMPDSTPNMFIKGLAVGKQTSGAQWADYTDYGWPIDNAPCLLGVIYPSDDTTKQRIIFAAGMGGSGFRWTKNDGAGWSQLGAAVGVFTHANTAYQWNPWTFDPATNKLYVYERPAGKLWRIDVDPATSALSNPTVLITVAPDNPNGYADAVGWVTHKPGGDEVWLSAMGTAASGDTGLYYATSASTATSMTKSQFNNAYPGEMPGFVYYRPSGDFLVMSTLSLDQAGNIIYGPNGKNGSFGPRLLAISTPKAANATNFKTNSQEGDDRAFHGALGLPHSIDWAPDGTYLLVAVYGAGVNGGLWKIDLS